MTLSNNWTGTTFVDFIEQLDGNAYKAGPDVSPNIVYFRPSYAYNLKTRCPTMKQSDHTCYCTQPYEHRQNTQK
ncbi:MAG: hypothetical protein ACYTDW_11020 [Planctomycetota bacterium]